MAEDVVRVNLTTGGSLSVPSITGAQVPDSGAFSFGNISAMEERVSDQLEDLQSIYPEPSPQLQQVVTILSEAIYACSEAIESEENANKFQSDDCMLRAQKCAMELFGFRKLGDGLGVVSIALMFAFINKGGKPFNRAEMHAILRTFKELYSAPFLPIESAVRVTTIIEQAGLVVDPLPLTDLLTEAQEAGFVDAE